MPSTRLMRPKTRHIKVEDITIENSDSLKFLVFSDLHIGQFSSLSVTRQQVYDKINQLIEMVHPTHIFILGDIVHVNIFHLTSAWTDFYEMLENFHIPIMIIPGNHERYIHGLVKNSFHGNYVKLYNVELLRIHVNGIPNPLIFGHDVKNDKKVHTTELVRQWMTMLRTTFQNEIPEESIMVLGHVHGVFNSVDNKTFTLDPFSPGLHCYHYGVIIPSENHDFNVSFSYLEP